MKKTKAPTTDDWRKKYTPVENPRGDLGWGFDDKCHLFDTFGSDLDFVKKQKSDHVWTLVDGDDGTPMLVAGFHFVNRVGYVVTKEPWTDEGEFYEDE